MIWIMTAQIINYMATLPMWVLILIVLIAIFCVDVFYTMWFKFVGDNKKIKAGLASCAIYLCSVTGISTILEINNWLIIPALFAAFLGTVSTMHVYEKIKLKKEKKENV